MKIWSLIRSMYEIETYFASVAVWIQIFSLLSNFEPKQSLACNNSISICLVKSHLLLFLWRFEAAGRPLAKAKEFLNVINAPLLSYPDETKLSDIYDIPGLHCMTGIVAKLIKEIEKSFDCWLPRWQQHPQDGVPGQPQFRGQPCQGTTM